MNANIAKGLLILLVIVDHNNFSRGVFPGFLEGFAFHVMGFMTLPFLRPALPLDRHFGQYLFRLYHPFFVMVTGLALIVAVIDHVPALAQLRLWALSLYSGNADVLKQTTHMYMLWYLPSFVALVALRTGIEHVGAVGKTLALVLLCALHPAIGPVADAIQDFLPLGLLPALYVVPLAYLAALVHGSLLMRLPRTAALAASAAVYVAIKTLQMRAGLHNEVGFAEVAGYDKPLALLLNDLEAVTGVWMVFQLARFDLGRFVETAGKYSLQMYLFHAFVAAGVSKVLVIVFNDVGVMTLFCVSFVLSSVLALAVSRYLGEQALVKRLMFPRSVAELAGALRLPPVRAARGQQR